MKVWITKYALTKGLIELDVEQSNYYPNMVSGKSGNGVFHGEGREWHKTRDSDLKRADELRLKKIVSLKKQIERLEKLRFE